MNRSSICEYICEDCADVKDYVRQGHCLPCTCTMHLLTSCYQAYATDTIPLGSMRYSATWPLLYSTMNTNWTPVGVRALYHVTDRECIGRESSIEIYAHSRPACT